MLKINKVSNNDTINTFKQIYNNFVDNVSQYSNYNLIDNNRFFSLKDGNNKNKLLKWNILQNNLNYEIDNGLILKNNISAGEIFEQITNKKIFENKRYTFYVRVKNPIDKIYFEIEYPDGTLINLENLNDTTKTILYLDNFDGFKSYFVYFKSSEDLSNLDNQIKIRCCASENFQIQDEIKIQEVSLYEGYLDSTGIIYENPFLLSLYFDKNNKKWKITTDGENYYDFLLDNEQSQETINHIIENFIENEVDSNTILNKIKQVDGSGSELDADTLDGLDSSVFLRSDIDDVANGNIEFKKDIIIDGNGLFKNNVNINGNATINGNLIVNGTMTTVNTEELTIKDNIITLNSNLTNGNPPSNLKSGIEVLRGDNPKATFYWNENNDEWQFEEPVNVNKISFNYPENEENTDLFFIYRHNVSHDHSDLRIQIGDNVTGDDKLVIGTAPAGNWKDLFKFYNNGNAEFKGKLNVKKLEIQDSSIITNLNADLLDGHDSSYFAKNDLSNVPNSNILNKLKQVDGSGSGLDADLLDGKDSNYFFQLNEYAIPSTWSPKSDWQKVGGFTINHDYGKDTYIVLDNDNGRKVHLVIDGDVYVNEGSKRLAYDDLSNVSNNTILNKLKQVDGNGSGLDADTLDGHDSSYFTNANNLNSGIISSERLSGDYNINVTSAEKVKLTVFQQGVDSPPPQYFSNGLYAIDGYYSTDFPDFYSKHYYSGYAVMFGNGQRGSQFVVNWNGELGKPLSVAVRIKDDTQNDWGEWDYLTFTDLRNVDNNIILDKLKQVDGSGSGLDADLLDGHNSSYFAKNDLSNVANSNILNKLKQVDGSGSGLDADLLDGHNSSYFAKNDLSNVSDNDFKNKYNSAIGNGSGSGLDADTLDGHDSSYFTNANNLNSGIISSERLSGDYNINVTSAEKVKLTVFQRGVDSPPPQYFSNGLYAIDGYYSTDFPDFPDNRPKHYYSGYTVMYGNGYRGSQFVVNWDGELGKPVSVAVRIKDDTQDNWGEWGYLTFTDLRNVDNNIILDKLKQVDGSGSGLDADLLDGHDSTYFAKNDLSNVSSDIIKSKLISVGEINLTNSDLFWGQDSDSALITFSHLGDNRNDLNIILSDDMYPAAYADKISFKFVPGDKCAGGAYNCVKNPSNWVDIFNIYGFKIETHKDFLPNQDNIIDIGSSSKRFKNIHANTFKGNSIEVENADLAEQYICKDELEIGDVVVISSDMNYEIEKSNEINSHKVLGVFSDNPALKMNNVKIINGKFIALKGRLPIKVIGKVNKGDPLVSYKNGYAISIFNEKIKNIKNYFIFAKALEKSETKYNLIECVIL